MRRFFQHSDSIFFDTAPCPSFKYPEDFDSDYFSEFTRMAGITVNISESSLLENLRLIAVNKQLTNAAVLFFGKNIQSYIAHATIRCVLFKGIDKRYILDSKEITGNLVVQYEEALKYIISKLNLRYEIENQKGGLLKEILEIPECLLILLLPCLATLSNAQDRIRQYVQQALVPISSIQPGSTEDTDLQVIGKAIGNSRVVMLGEQAHGDAPDFLAKTRIIQYLHEKKGFNVLAFESDFFGLNDGWENLPKDQHPTDSFIRRNVFGVWTNCNTGEALFYHYIPATAATATPLILTGFDNQMILGYSYFHLVHRLDSLLRSLDLAITKQTRYTTEFLPLMDSLTRRYSFAPPKADSIFAKCADLLTEVKTEAGAKLQKDDFWMMACFTSGRYILAKSTDRGSPAPHRLSTPSLPITIPRHLSHPATTLPVTPHPAEKAGFGYASW